MSIVVLFVVLTAIALSAPRYGVDGRSPTGGRRQTTPTGDLVALGRRLRRSVLAR